jgi:hypothetical protein
VDCGRSSDRGGENAVQIEQRNVFAKRELQREAKRTGQPTDELIQLSALERFLDRLVHSEFADTFILKGGVLLAALDARRPTRDIDFAVRVFENSAEKILSAVRKISAIPLDDGMIFDSGGAAAEAIREEDAIGCFRNLHTQPPCRFSRRPTMQRRPCRKTCSSVRPAFSLWECSQRHSG